MLLDENVHVHVELAVVDDVIVAADAGRDTMGGDGSGRRRRRTVAVVVAVVVVGVLMDVVVVVIDRDGSDDANVVDASMAPRQRRR